MSMWAMVTAAVLLLASPVAAQDLPPAARDIAYPDLEAIKDRLEFQRSGDPDLTEISLKEDSASIIVSYNQTPILRFAQKDYPGGAYLLGPIVTPDGSRFELNKPQTILKGSGVYVLVVLKTRIFACTQYGYIVDVTTHFPVATSQLHLCQAKIPLVGIHPDGTVEISLESYRPKDTRPDKNSFIQMIGMPAQRYTFKTGDADVVRKDYPVTSADEAAKIEAQADVRVKQELDRNPYIRPDPILGNFFEMLVAANKRFVAQQEYCRNHAEECRQEAQRAADMQDRIDRSRQETQMYESQMQQQYVNEHGR